MAASASIALALVACQTPPVAPQADSDHEGRRPTTTQASFDSLSPTARLLQSGDRVEITLTRPDSRRQDERVRAVIDHAGMIELPLIGAVPAAGKTERQLEQNLLTAYNSEGRLRGAVRVARAPLPRDGFFLPAPIDVFGRVMSDPRQVQQLEGNLHADWQWVRVSREMNRMINGRPMLMTVRRGGASWTLARPAHSELVSDRLTRNIARVVDRPHETGMKLTLRPAAAVVMEKVAKQSAGRPVLLVVAAEVVDTPILEAAPPDAVVLTRGASADRQRQALQTLSRVE